MVAVKIRLKSVVIKEDIAAVPARHIILSSKTKKARFNIASRGPSKAIIFKLTLILKIYFKIPAEHSNLEESIRGNLFSQDLEIAREAIVRFHHQQEQRRATRKGGKRELFIGRVYLRSSNQTITWRAQERNKA